LNKTPAKRPNSPALFKTPFLKKHAETNPVLKNILEQITPAPVTLTPEVTPPVTPRAKEETKVEEKKTSVVDERKKKTPATKSATPVRKEEVVKQESREEVLRKEKPKKSTPQRVHSARIEKVCTIQNFPGKIKNLSKKSKKYSKIFDVENFCGQFPHYFLYFFTIFLIFVKLQ
jgi:hypothetical protein